jgi:hypothetical protein
MKTIKKQMRLIAFTLAMLIYFQSCKVYHSNSVTLEQASQEFKRVKIQTNGNEILKFRGIKMENKQYYGVKKVKKELINTLIEKDNIKSVRLENETMSTILTIALPVTIVIGALVIIGSSLSNWDLSGLDNPAF